MSPTNDNKKGFLILKRQKGQGVVINGDIEIIVKKITDKNVQLAFKGPKGTQILRTELINKTEK